MLDTGPAARAEPRLSLSTKTEGGSYSTSLSVPAREYRDFAPRRLTGKEETALAPFFHDNVFPDLSIFQNNSLKSRVGDTLG